MVSKAELPGSSGDFGGRADPAAKGSAKALAAAACMPAVDSFTPEPAARDKPPAQREPASARATPDPAPSPPAEVASIQSEVQRLKDELRALEDAWVERMQMADARLQQLARAKADLEVELAAAHAEQQQLARLVARSQEVLNRAESAESRRAIVEPIREAVMSGDKMSHMAKQLAVAQQKAKQYAEEVIALRASTSWRVTSGLRKLSKLRSVAMSAKAKLAPRRAEREATPAAGKRPAPASSDDPKGEPGKPAAARPVPKALAQALEHNAPSARLPTDVVAELRFRTGFWKLSADLAAHVEKHGPVSHLIAVPWFSIGGAELAASFYARAAADRGTGSAILLGVDRRLEGVDRLPPPPRTTMLELSDYFPDADLVDREALLFAVIRMLRPAVFHNINSEAGWRAIVSMGERMRAMTRVFGSIFALQFDWATGKRIGYAESFLRDGLPHLDGLLSDNQRFITDAADVYELGAARSRMHAVYNPRRSWSEEEQSAAERRVEALADALRAATRLQVLWAGRFDAEKRPELLFETARLAQDMDFHVYGAKVVDDRHASISHVPPNVVMHGPYTSLSEVTDARVHHVFMFTSRWEGMPNSLIEFGSMGFPVVAATVGGVVELIDETTGYPLAERPTAADYVAAIRQAHKNPAGAAARARALMQRIAERHDYLKFRDALYSVPGYMPPRERPS
jgi:glycosyltransferase involved in cell wall biosynthesis